MSVRAVQFGAAGFCLILVLALVAARAVWKPATPRERFLEAFAAQGVPAKKLAEIRLQFERASLDKERDPCNDSYRMIAGQAAVEYYEVLLEKPFLRAKLTMTDRNVYSSDSRGAIVRREPLSLAAAFNQGLRLPWDCLPDEWRTPVDLALQSKLESDIRDGRLTSDALEGTLGLLSRPLEKSPHLSSCVEKTTVKPNTYTKRLPLLAAPPDDWSGSRRRR